MSTPSRNLPVASFDSYEPTEEGVEPTPRPDWALSDERLPVFSYTDENGVRVDVTMPKRPNPGLALDFLRTARRQGTELAISWLIEEAIGAEGYDALVRELAAMPDPENGAKVVASIGERVQQVIMGGLEGPKG